MKLLRFITLADNTGAHELLYNLPGIRHMEVAAQAAQSALDPFMVVVMDGGEEHGQEGERLGNEQALLEQNQTIHNLPRLTQRTLLNLTAQATQFLICGCRLPELVQEVERRRGDGVQLGVRRFPA